MSDYGLGALPVNGQGRRGRALLRITPQALYDLESTGTSSITQLGFYVNQINKSTTNGSITKNYGETNMDLSGQLGAPYEFTLFGFNVKYRSNTAGTAITQTDLETLMLNGWLEFKFGNRIYLRLPLADIPSGVALDGITTQNNQAYIHNGVPHRSNILKYMVGKNYVHIYPTEPFSVSMNWPAGITMTVAVRAQVYLQGLLHNAI